MHCDCATQGAVKRLTDRNVKTHVVCATPSALKGRAIKELDPNELNCDGRKSKLSSDINSAGSPVNMVKLVEEDGRTMFVCEVDENLTLDKFETSNADNDEELSIETLGIQNVAANIVGEHECTYELRSVKAHVKLMVTSEANSRSDISVNSKFHAEIVVPTEIVNDVNTNHEIIIRCANSGERLHLVLCETRSGFFYFL